LIVAVAVASVALTIAVAGIASANPPVPPPNETAKITDSTHIINPSGSCYMERTYEKTYTNKDLRDDELENDERVAQIRHDLSMTATDGYTEVNEEFTVDGQDTPNLKVDRKVGFVKGDAVTSSLDLTENTGIGIVSEGDTGGSTGVGALCVWAQNACIPPSNGLVAAGSQLKDVKLVNAHTITAAQTTESPQLHHEITAGGPTVEGGNETLGMGTVAAGMKASIMEGTNCNRSHPLASRETYNVLARATGMWNFKKSMTYIAQIPVINIPSQYPIFPW